jgi:CHAT domain-containing protein
LYSRQGKIHEAINSYRLALEVFSSTADPVNCQNSASGLGEVAFNAERWDEAIEGYSLAIISMEQSRNWINARYRKREILQNGIGLYSKIVQAYLKLGKSKEAITYVERCKVRNLVELIADRKLLPKGKIPEITLEKFQELQQEIVLEQQRLEIDAQGLNRQKDNELFHAFISQDETKLQSLNQQINNLIQDEIQAYDPAFSLTHTLETISFADIQKLLSNQQTALIEWFIAEETFIAFIVTHNSPNPIVWQSSSQDFHSLRIWANEYTNFYYHHWQQWQKDLSIRLEKLSRILHLEELLSFLPENCNQLILIPYRSLHSFPLHALPLSDGSFLLDHFPNGIRYAPSCQLLKLSQEYEYPHLSHLFAFQNPTEDLLYAGLEVQTIKQNFNSHNILIKKEAQRSTIDSQCFSTSNCIHFACHGFFNLMSPMLSGLSLAGSEIDSPTANDITDFFDLAKKYFSLPDGKSLDLSKCLTLGDVFDQNLSGCRLVTLSACETGLSDYTSTSDEYIGLPSGFLVAGAASVVSSLWTVNDLSTALLMIKFYENLQTEISISIALNQAQVWLRDITGVNLKQWIRKRGIALSPTLKLRWLNIVKDDDQPFQSPYYWAAFCAIGQ